MHSDINTISLPDASQADSVVRNEETELVRACINQDRLAQAKLYKQHYGLMMSVCMRYIQNRDEAMEVLNTGFLKIFQNLSKWHGGSLQGWIRRIMTNTAIDQLRHSVTYKEHIMPEEFEVLLNEEVSNKLLADDLLKLVNSLPNEQKIVFNMYSIEGYKHREISDILNISEGTSKWYLSEARKQLKVLIEKNYTF